MKTVGPIPLNMFTKLDSAVYLIKTVYFPYVQMQWVHCPHHHPLKMIFMLHHHHYQCLLHQRICTKSLLHLQWKGSPGYLKIILKKVGCYVTLFHWYIVKSDNFSQHFKKDCLCILHYCAHKVCSQPKKSKSKLCNILLWHEIQYMLYSRRLMMRRNCIIL